MTGLARGRRARGGRSRWLDAVLGLALVAAVRYAVTKGRGDDLAADEGPVVRPNLPAKEPVQQEPEQQEPAREKAQQPAQEKPQEPGQEPQEKSQEQTSGGGAPAALVDVPEPERDPDPDPDSEPEPEPERDPEPEPATSDDRDDSTEARADDSAPTSDGEASGQRVQTERLTVDEIGTGDLDGVWWPESTTAAETIPQLVGDLPDALGRVLRVALPMPDWSDEQPKTVTVDDRPVHVSWFQGMRRHTARVTFDTDAIITVLVLPPDTEQDAASNALNASAEERSRSNLLQTAGIEPADGSDDDADSDAPGTDTGDSGNDSSVGADSEG